MPALTPISLWDKGRVEAFGDVLIQFASAGRYRKSIMAARAGRTRR